MQWLAESLDKKASETAEDTIRRYLASKFYKDHMQTYKKRPIYWLFSSGKQGAFQALVYLHRYNESTLARMRTEYVMPLISKMAAYANSLETDKENSDSAAEIKRIEKKLQDLHKQQAELSSFEEKLRHYADQRITLDLDDGVKVNYGKFGYLLAERNKRHNNDNCKSGNQRRCSQVIVLVKVEIESDLQKSWLDFNGKRINNLRKAGKGEAGKWQ